MIKALSLSFVPIFLLTLLPPPAVADSQQNARLALHLQPRSGGSATLCGTSAPIDVPCQNFNTTGRTGVGYDAYILATRLDAEYGLAGLSFGVQFDGERGQGVDVFGWTPCSTLEFSQRNWPESGGGIRLTWDRDRDCQREVLSSLEGARAIGGSIYVYAYGPDVLSVTPNYFDTYEEFQAADCADPTNLSNLPDRARGALRFSSDGTVEGYNPCTGEGSPPPPATPPGPPLPPNPPPPPPTAPQEASVFFHVAPVSGMGDQACDTSPHTAAEVVTGLAAEENDEYLVYLLGSPRFPESGWGLAGMQLGIEYTESVTVLDWYSCSNLEFKRPGWPSTGSGIIMTWVTTDCPQSAIVPAGFFRVRVDGSGTMSVVGYPPDGLVKVANCAASEIVLDRIVPDAQLGWLSFGGGGGCNPLWSPCDQTVATEAVTWGRLKALYPPDDS